MIGFPKSLHVFSYIKIRGVDPEPLNSDPDPDPDPGKHVNSDPDPGTRANSDPDPDPGEK